MEACYTEISLADIQSMMSLDYHSQLCSSRNIEEVVQRFLPYIDNSIMMNFNKIERGMWIGMIFTPRFHGIYCLSFCLNHDGMNLMADNFKFLKGIEGIKLNVAKMMNLLLCLRECLNRYKNSL